MEEICIVATKARSASYVTERAGDIELYKRETRRCIEKRSFARVSRLLKKRP
ncbi:hypothetical protein X777_16144 [Ooceraea biroi]|uniref:Uncharacterized protein n=1 Tax=Ooceraea biroi TaxID=2015173 RepID=A0A026WW55_OOCBI|nr:hypothetical protein X777_16144 [Ooceraea biroi]